MIEALEVFRRLREGNARFVSGEAGREPVTDHGRRVELATGQSPFAVILGCSDSRVPAEIVFDQGLGDLFVIRVAGNIVSPSQIGSVEFAVERFGIKLVIILGHSNCGAVTATIEELDRPTEARSPNLRSIVDRIRPVVATLLDTDERPDPETLIRRAVRANIRASVSQLRHGSRIIEDLVQQERLLVVGAEYSLETGIVEFLDSAEAL
jgi:carbonic anhydrase